MTATGPGGATPGPALLARRGHRDGRAGWPGPPACDRRGNARWAGPTPPARETPFSSSSPPNAPGRGAAAHRSAPRSQADGTPHGAWGAGGRRSGAARGTEAAGREARDGDHAGPRRRKGHDASLRAAGALPARRDWSSRWGHAWSAAELEGTGVSGVLPASPHPIRPDRVGRQATPFQTPLDPEIQRPWMERQSSHIPSAGAE